MKRKASFGRAIAFDAWGHNGVSAPIYPASDLLCQRSGNRLLWGPCSNQIDCILELLGPTRVSVLTENAFLSTDANLSQVSVVRVSKV